MIVPPTLPVPVADLTDAAETFPDRVAGIILAAFYAVHRELGHGFVESVYVRALMLELIQRGIDIEAESPLSVFYKGTKVGLFRAPLIVEGRVVVQVRTTDHPADLDRLQLRNHMRCAQAEIGLLLHFGPAPDFLLLDGVASPGRTASG
jgi:GxxExxY protein